MPSTTPKVLELLIVDDSPDDVFAIKRQLKKEGFGANCHRVDSPKALQQALERQAWDVALCDVKMPLLTPEEAIEMMNQYGPPKISIILMSGAVDIESLSQLIRGGVRDFLPKDQLYRLVSMLKREISYLEALHAKKLEHKMFVEAQKMEAVAVLAGGVAHDFNNILMALMGLQWITKSKYADLPDLVKNIDKMDDLCNRASGMVKQMLGFARKGIVQTENIELASFFKENWQLFQMSVPASIHMSLKLPDLPLHIQADSTQLQQMMINMTNNARDASSVAVQSNIQVHLEYFEASQDFLKFHQIQGKQWARVSISNNGMPVPTEVRPHIFEPFFTTKERGKGTGLGLAMVYGTMQTLQGLVELALDIREIQKDDSISEELCTTFHMYFPIATTATADLNQSTSIDSLKKTSSASSCMVRKLLVADDEDAVRDSISTMLEMAGYQVSRCDDGAQAWQTFKQDAENYDVVILDVVMPKMEGPEVARAIRQQSDTPIILISGYDMDDTLKLVDGVSNIKVLRKPFYPNKLLEAVASAVDGER